MTARAESAPSVKASRRMDSITTQCYRRPVACATTFGMFHVEQRVEDRRPPAFDRLGRHGVRRAGRVLGPIVRSRSVGRLPRLSPHSPRRLSTRGARLCGLHIDGPRIGATSAASTQPCLPITHQTVACGGPGVRWTPYLNASLRPGGSRRETFFALGFGINRGLKMAVIRSVACSGSATTKCVMSDTIWSGSIPVCGRSSTSASSAVCSI